MDTIKLNSISLEKLPGGVQGLTSITTVPHSTRLILERMLGRCIWNFQKQ